jgi:DNA polymerase III alpha subunit
MESSGFTEMVMKMKPSCFEDVIAAGALYRPGPLDQKLEDGRTMVDVYIDRKHGRDTITYPHPTLEPVLKDTYGVIVYQEQVMQIAQVLGGYTLGGADLLRRAMGKKKAEEMAKQRALFLDGSKTLKSVDDKIASGVFDLMEKFAQYGFNKSHSAAYGLITIHTAWLKAHYRVEFMAALLTLDKDNTDKVVAYIAEGTTESFRWPSVPDWDQDLRFSYERESLGFYVSGHPLEKHRAAIQQLATCSIEDLVNRANDESVAIVGLVTGKKEKLTKKGSRMAFLNVEDLTGSVEVIAFPEVLASAQGILEADEPIFIRGTVDVAEGGAKVIAEEVRCLAEAKGIGQVHVALDGDRLPNGGLQSLQTLFQANPGGCKVVLHVVRRGICETVLELPQARGVRPTEGLIRRLGEEPATESVWVSS